MKSGKAIRVALRMILWSLIALLALLAASWVGHVLGSLIITFYQAFFVAWALFACAVLYLCRDPKPIEPADAHAIVAPAHGTVDAVDEAVESDFVKEACRRVSISMSLFDVQVQYAPVAATIAHQEHHFTSSGRGKPVETLLLGLEPAARPADRLAVRIVAGTWGRRILPWTSEGDALARTQRVSMTRPGTRVELFLPRHVKTSVRVGDKVVGGQSVVAKFDLAYG